MVRFSGDRTTPLASAGRSHPSASCEAWAWIGVAACLHVNLLADPEDPAQMRAITACLHEVFRLVLSLEGTISGEHGVGIEKRDYVGWEIAEGTLDVMRALKHTLDPKGILNPGKALPGI